MQCSSPEEASICNSLCCNKLHQCSQYQSECSIYSDNHCIKLNCDTCCLLQDNQHFCGTYVQCSKYFDLFYLWCLIILGLLLVVLLIIKLRTKFMTARMIRIHQAFAKFNKKTTTI
ncbi:unnamed protein product [Paramecium pentaurelia]|uniref:Uncharacterized protein n=1 Tax=Paramecium pentaurelia TaxID=43138 RepID=A0A8S1XW48_9CILI|nr:unnamed protein product [Paramecium pentaurelia]